MDICGIFEVGMQVWKIGEEAFKLKLVWDKQTGMLSSVPLFKFC